MAFNSDDFPSIISVSTVSGDTSLSETTGKPIFYSICNNAHKSLSFAFKRFLTFLRSGCGIETVYSSVVALQ